MRLFNKKATNKVANKTATNNDSRYESGITKVAHAGEELRIKNAKVLEVEGNKQISDDVWYFATDTFGEVTELVRIIQLSDEKVQLEGPQFRSSNATEILLKKFKKIVDSRNSRAKVSGIESRTLTKEGLNGCEKIALSKITELEKAFLGTPVNEKNMYALKYGQIRYAKAIESCRVVCEAWININDIGFNSTTGEWEYLG